MTHAEFQELKHGDICVIRTGSNKDKKCRVVYIDDHTETILIKPLPNDRFLNWDNPHIHLTGWRNLEVIIN